MANATVLPSALSTVLSTAVPNTAITTGSLLILPNATDLLNTTANVNATASSADSEPAAYRAAGVTMAICSGFFIGASFIFKKKGLIDTKAKHGDNGSAHNYLKSPFWWAGLLLRFIVYCFLCMFAVLYLIYYISPRYGEKNPIVYISICSIVGSFLVLSMQGFGSAVVYTANHWADDNQFLLWETYPLLGFIIFMVMAQLHFLNKALGQFSTAIVTPVYYVFFTSMTLLSSAVLFRGFAVESVTAGVSLIFGFFVIVGGVGLLFQYSIKVTRRTELHKARSAARRQPDDIDDGLGLENGAGFYFEEEDDAVYEDDEDMAGFDGEKAPRISVPGLPFRKKIKASSTMDETAIDMEGGGEDGADARASIAEQTVAQGRGWRAVIHRDRGKNNGRGSATSSSSDLASLESSVPTVGSTSSAEEAGKTAASPAPQPRLTPSTSNFRRPSNGSR
ncbi:hypothetical protein HK101_003362, partial [Irineochytrium annulatum]